MTDSITAALRALGHTLPVLTPPVGNFVSCVQWGPWLQISGQVGFAPAGATPGARLGDGLSIPEGQAAARQAALSLLAQVAQAADDRLSRIVKVVRLGVYVAATADFQAHPQVANGASDLCVALLGDRGRHARTAIGVASLPLGAAVEVDAWLVLQS